MSETAALNRPAARHEVYAGSWHIGSVVDAIGAWRASAADGHTIGNYETQAEATAAVFRHLHRAKRSNS